MIIDSHCHVSDIWYEPAETLLFQMDRCGVERAILIQMLGQFDNRYQQACARRWEDRFHSVVAVDPALPDAALALRALAGEGARGVRLRPNARSPGEDPLAIWRTAADQGLTVSCVGAASQFTAPEFVDLIAQLPDLTVVLEHLGGVARPDADESADRIWDLARFPNLALKVPGLGQLSRRITPPPAQGSPFEAGGEASIRRAVEVFSAERLMWGSDFPVVSSREGYARSLGGVRSCLEGVSQVEQANIFGGAAARFFGQPATSE